MMALANAVKGMVESLAQAQKAAGGDEPVTVDVKELFSKFGIPVTAATPESLEPPEPPAPEGGLPNPKGSGPEKASLGNLVQAYITKERGAYVVHSESGKSLGRYRSRKEAETRLRQIEYFKHQSLKLAAFREGDHPRDETGQFSPGAATGAAGRASKSADSPEGHAKAAEAHRIAAEAHKANKNQAQAARHEVNRTLHEQVANPNPSVLERGKRIARLTDATRHLGGLEDNKHAASAHEALISERWGLAADLMARGDKEAAEKQYRNAAIEMQAWAKIAAKKLAT